MSFYKVSALSVLAISLAACSSSGDKTDSQPATTIPSATTGTAGNTNTGSTTNTGNTGTTTPTTPAPTTPVVQPTVLVPAPIAPTGKALEAANKAKILPVPKPPLGGILRPAVFDGRTTPYTNKDKTVSSGEFVIPSTDFVHGFSEQARDYRIRKDNANYDVRSVDRVYNQNYSIIYGTYFQQADYDDSVNSNNTLTYRTCLIQSGWCTSKAFLVNAYKGQATEIKDMPAAGKATYRGTAFSGKGTGSIIYDVNFDTQKGSGTLNVSDITGTVVLKEANITAGGIAGDLALTGRDYNGNYELKFYGPQAAEIAGKATIEAWSANSSVINAPWNGSEKTEIGFGGTRGAITK